MRHVPALPLHFVYVIVCSSFLLLLKGVFTNTMDYNKKNKKPQLPNGKRGGNWRG